MIEEFDGRRKQPVLSQEEVLAALGTLLTEYARINTLLDRANARMTATERAQKQASNRTFNSIRSLYRRAMGIVAGRQSLARHRDTSSPGTSLSNG